MTLPHSDVGGTAGRAATRELAEFIGEEGQRDAGLKMLTTENTPVNGGEVTADDTEMVAVGQLMGSRDSFENVDSSFAQHCMSRVMGAVPFLSPDTAEEDGLLRQCGSLARAVLLAQQKLGSLESVRRCSEISILEVREYPPQLTFLVWASTFFHHLRGCASLCNTWREVRTGSLSLRAFCEMT